VGLCSTLTLTYSLGACTRSSGPSPPDPARRRVRGTGRMRMPSAASRANSTAQPGSSTITWSPARSSVRLTMSSAWVAPTVVMICSGVRGTCRPASFCASAGAGRVAQPARRTAARTPAAPRAGHLAHAAGMKLLPASRAETPMPGCGLSLTLWNMPRISAAAFTGGRRAPARMAVGVLQAPRLRHREQACAGDGRRPRAQKSRGCAAPPPAPAPAAGRRRPPRWTGSRPAARALAHRRQARAGRQQPGADALGKRAASCSVRDWVAVFISMAGHPWAWACTGKRATNTDLHQLRCQTVLVVYWSARLH
jgi:hypothetical protein